ncbi:MAG: divergent polysaccharide deacetylase family protein [Dongiaceae bacterium]
MNVKRLLSQLSPGRRQLLRALSLAFLAALIGGFISIYLNRAILFTQREASSPQAEILVDGTTAPKIEAAPANVPLAEVFSAPSAPAEMRLEADAALQEISPAGVLPKIAPDGRQAWQVYAAPFDKTSARPRIALIITGLGLSAAITDQAIATLPKNITLAFSPYAKNVQNFIDRARQAGHEAVLNLPLEPQNYPLNDPGPDTLLVKNTPAENAARLHRVLAKGKMYVGVLPAGGERFLTERSALDPLLQELRARGLLFIDSSRLDSLAISASKEIGLHSGKADLVVDLDASKSAIDSQLQELEKHAASTGTAIGIGFPYPSTLERVAAWASRLEAKGLALVPITAAVDR